MEHEDKKNADSEPQDAGDGGRRMGLKRSPDARPEVLNKLALGIALGGAADAAGWRRALRIAQRADALGLHSLWLPENHFAPGATPTPLVALAAFAARTRRIRLATTSLLLPLQHPLRIAADVATLDALSNGRVLLGLGRGFRTPVFEGFGVRAGEKRDRFDEALDAILAAWSGEPVVLEGEHYASRDAVPVQIGLRPVQRPHPPLLVAAFGPKGLLQAARRGLPYLASPLETLEVLEQNFALWRSHLAFDPPPGDAPRIPVMRTVFITDDAAEARRVRAALHTEIARSSRARGLKNPLLARVAAGGIEKRALIGSPSEVEDQLARYRERLGLDLLIARVEVPGVSEASRDKALESLVTLAG